MAQLDPQSILNMSPQEALLNLLATAFKEEAKFCTHPDTQAFAMRMHERVTRYADMIGMTRGLLGFLQEANK